MGAAMPKQFLPLAGVPVLVRTVQAFLAFDPALALIVVLPQAEHAHWAGLCAMYSLPPHDVVAGGSSRTESVRAGLSACAPNSVVAVHDGVRPLVSADLLERCFAAAESTGAAIPVLPLTDSLRRLEGDGRSTAANRADFVAVQTPQCFHFAVLDAAYTQATTEATDDATLVERLGHPIALVPGERRNIKLTTPEDMALAELWLAEC